MPEPRERVTTVIRREPLIEKVCPGCGVTFPGLRRQKYHDNNCAQRAAYARHAEARKAAARLRHQRRKLAG